MKRPVGRKFLIWVGQTQHAIGTRLTMWSSGYTVRHISPIEEQAALSQGADLFSESFIFFVSGGVLVFEYFRSSEKEKVKEEANLQKIRDEAALLQAKLDSLDKRLVSLEEYAKANRSAIVIGKNAKYFKPDGVVPIIDEKGERSHEMNSQLATERRKRRWWPF